MNAIPSVALGRMAWLLACSRSGNTSRWATELLSPLYRELLTPFADISTEYYRIIDRISAGEKP